MVDVYTKAKRSELMSRIRSRDTRPERLVRSTLHRLGYRFRLHRADLPGKPDIVLPRYSAVIFVHGCFWHRHAGCSYAVLPSSNRVFWSKKLNGNRRRDRLSVQKLRGDGWRVAVLWECATRNAERHAHALKRLAEWVRSSKHLIELP